MKNAKSYFFARALFAMLLLCKPYWALAQILPEEASSLNYRLICFQFPATPGSKEYVVEIATGTYNNADSFKDHIIETLRTKNNNVIAEVPAFGANYTWRAISTKKNNTSAPLHHFSTLYHAATDTNLNRLRITDTAKRYEDAYVFLDGNGALYSMKGQPVWFLPHVDGINVPPRDLKITDRGTITLLLGEQGYEINYNGDIVWRAPNIKSIKGVNTQHYHHELTRLSNGHYMILSNEIVSLSMPLLPDRPRPGADIMNKRSADSTHKPKDRKVPFGSIIEYDEKGKEVWSWSSADFLLASDLYKAEKRRKIAEVDAHENSFYFDEKNKELYLSFRTISTILKIKYPEGTIMNVYGAMQPPDNSPEAQYMFCGQHSCKVSEKGYLYLFNNGCFEGKPPSVVMMEQPVRPQDSLKKIWEYSLEAENLKMAGARNVQLTMGGNVVELPDHSIFISMSAPYNNVLITDLAKKILWQATPEKWDATEHKWKTSPHYRASIIKNKDEMQQLIRSAGPMKKK